MESPRQNATSRLRFISFWAGAVLTVAFSTVTYVMVVLGGVDDSRLILFVFVFGPPTAYWIAWIGSGRPWVRGMAIALFIGSLVPAIASVMLFAAIPGIIGLAGGTPDRFRTLKPEQ